jgi:hypothetical protein
MISVDDETAPIAQNAAIMAVEDWYSCNKGSGDDETVPGDVNGDGTVDVADISSVISAMAGDLSVSNSKADVNGDGTVDVADISTIISIMAGDDIVIVHSA